MRSLSPAFLKIWAVLITALGAWYAYGWMGAELQARDNFSLAIGIFCMIAGVMTLLFSFKMNKK